LQRTQLASARTDKKATTYIQRAFVKSGDALAAPANQVCAETYFLELIPTNALVLINGDKLLLLGSPSVILGPDLIGDKLHGPMGIETRFQSFVKQWIKLPGES
jgi:hypothetical protein